MSPYSDAEWSKRWLAGMQAEEQQPVREYTVRLEHGGSTGLPYASGLGECARQLFMSIQKEEKSDPGHPMYNWPTYMGYAGETYNRTILERMGYTVERPERIIHEGVVTVHPDGVLSGLDFLEPVLWDGKVRSSYAYKMLATQPMRQFDPTMYMQMQVSMAATNTKLTMVTLHPHDLSAVRGDMRRYKWGEHVVNPVSQRLFVSADAKAQELAVDRARALLAARELDMMVQREYNPTSVKHSTFPCGFCEWRTKCQAIDLEYEGREHELMVVPPIPEAWSEQV